MGDQNDFYRVICQSNNDVTPNIALKATHPKHEETVLDRSTRGNRCYVYPSNGRSHVSFFIQPNQFTFYRQLFLICLGVGGGVIIKKGKIKFIKKKN